MQYTVSTSVIMLSSGIDKVVVVEAGPILPAQMPASDRQRRCPLVQTKGTVPFSGLLKRANKDIA